MAFVYTDIEDEIVARLTTLLPAGYHSIPMPEMESQFNIGKNKVLILVAYSDSTFEKTDSIDIINQTENVTVLCNIKSPRLRGTFSINEALQLLKVCLVGFKPSNLTKLTPQKIEFEERNKDDNYFSYNFMLSGKKRNVEVPEDEVLPLLIKLTFNDGPGDFNNPDYDDQDFLVNSTLIEINSTL